MNMIYSRQRFKNLDFASKIKVQNLGFAFFIRHFQFKKTLKKLKWTYN